MFTLAVRGDVVTWVHCCYVGTLLLRGYIIVTWVYYCCVGTLLLRGYIIVTWVHCYVGTLLLRGYIIVTWVHYCYVGKCFCFSFSKDNSFSISCRSSSLWWRVMSFQFNECVLLNINLFRWWDLCVGEGSSWSIGDWKWRWLYGTKAG